MMRISGYLSNRNQEIAGFPPFLNLHTGAVKHSVPRTSTLSILCPWTTFRMGISNSAIIVVDFVAALASVSIAFGIFSIISPAQIAIWSPTIIQERYMRNLRLRYLKLLPSENGIKYSIFRRWIRSLLFHVWHLLTIRSLDNTRWWTWRTILRVEVNFKFEFRVWWDQQEIMTPQVETQGEAATMYRPILDWGAIVTGLQCLTATWKVWINERKGR